MSSFGLRRAAKAWASAFSAIAVPATVFGMKAFEYWQSIDIPSDLEVAAATLMTALTSFAATWSTTNKEASEGASSESPH